MAKTGDSDQKPAQPAVYSPNSDPADVPWTLMSVAQLEGAYRDHVEPVLRAENREPTTDRPSYEWLSANGFRGLVYALRERHDTTFAEFWDEDLGYGESDDYEWGVDDDATIDSFERFLTKRRDRLDWADRTVATHRYRLATFARAYADVNESSDLLGPVRLDDEWTPSAAADACRDALDHLDDAVGRRTLERVFRTARTWYGWLEDRHVAELNPVEGIRFNWSRDGDGEVDNPPLAPSHVRALSRAADGTREALLVVALCAWGLRSGEVAALHRSELRLGDEDGGARDEPHLSFESRKNGPGTVPIIYGADVASERVAQLVGEDWNGYLFPSQRSATGHVTRGTVLTWFRDLSDRAGLPDRIGGNEPTPQMARRFWYERYSATITALVDEHIQEIADEQGSASADVVWSDYVPEARRRQLRREFMREKLSDAFGGGDVPGSGQTESPTYGEGGR